MSADSQTDSSGSEDTSDNEHTDVKVNGYHDVENEVDHEADYDRDRRLSGKLTESSGSAASDLYDYKVLSLSLIRYIYDTHTYIIRLYISVF